MKKLALFGLILMVLFGCKKRSIEKQQVTAVDTNKTKVEYNFEIIMPVDTSIYSDVLFVMIDPRGDAKFAISKISSITSKYGFATIGLKNVRNNDPNFISKIYQNIEQVKQLTKKQFYKIVLVGFSGGARMAYYYSTTQKVDGLILCGASPEMNELKEIAIPTVLITGNTDFNFSESFYTPYSEIAKKENLIKLIFAGKHAWADEFYMDIAVSFVLKKFNYPTIYDFQKLDSLINLYKNSRDILLQHSLVEARYKLSIDSEFAKNKDAYNKFIAQNSVKQYFAKITNTIAEENKRNQLLVNQLPTQDAQWWTKQIEIITLKCNSVDSIVAQSYRRTHAYLGVVLYSFTIKELNATNSYYIDKFLTIYEMLEPENADMLFFKAVRQKQLGNYDASQQYYQQALDKGFSDFGTARKFGF